MNDTPTKKAKGKRWRFLRAWFGFTNPNERLAFLILLTILLMGVIARYLHYESEKESDKPAEVALETERRSYE